MDKQDAHQRQKERARLSRRGGEITLADMVPPDLANMPTSDHLLTQAMQCAQERWVSLNSRAAGPAPDDLSGLD